jgi:hypothetical protein
MTGDMNYSIAIALLTIVCTGCIQNPEAPPITQNLSCTRDEDCVFAYRLDQCCNCGQVYSRSQAEQDCRLLIEPELWNYSYPVPRCSSATNCQGILCELCQETPYVTCKSGTCTPFYVNIYPVPMENASGNIPFEKMRILSREEAKDYIGFCNHSIMKYEHYIIGFIQGNVRIDMEGYTKENAGELYCTECLTFTAAYQNNASNTYVVFSHHRQVNPDVSFDEVVTCEINERNQLTTFYVSATLGLIYAGS